VLATSYWHAGFDGDGHDDDDDASDDYFDGTCLSTRLLSWSCVIWPAMIF
jgi:hypothetical protein